jgi:hypothetical protein
MKYVMRDVELGEVLWHDSGGDDLIAFGICLLRYFTVEVSGALYIEVWSDV